MSTFFSELAEWFCLAVTAGLGGMLLYKLKNSPGQVRRRAICLMGLWGGFCLLSLSLYWGLAVLSLSCFLTSVYLSGQEMLPVDQKAVLITGCDSGIGHALSKYMDKLGFTVLAGVLNEKGAGAEELQRTCSSRLSVIQLDVTNPAQIREAYRKVVEKVQDRGLWAVINNAGIFGFPADGELLPMADYRQCMAVNFFGVVEVTKTFLPLLRKSKGRLVNISSMAAGVPMGKLAAYGSSKAALTMFSAVLRLELSRWGVKVAVIQPGGFKTNLMGTKEIWDKKQKNILDNLTPDVKEDYGQDYILSLWNYFGPMDVYCSSDYSPVLLDVQHAVSVKSPCALYTPGKGSYVWLCIASFLPAGMFDYLAKGMYSPGKKRTEP
ncbi:17-beta-hydroxysteroid dehydrogenase type 2 [Elephas maximus indicus]|uniref:17-beta-hydroxysteroid dehydrogenase type 2 n=1 Tax=Elephas maximus indicus TaxID=99487 RepID=UPI00211712D4|nr:17-beta-hydroxysteroid dehydrogenase type 2 [Elephas maximus indicus]